MSTRSVWSKISETAILDVGILRDVLLLVVPVGDAQIWSRPQVIVRFLGVVRKATFHILIFLPPQKNLFISELGPRTFCFVSIINEWIGDALARPKICIFDWFFS